MKRISITAMFLMLLTIGLNAQNFATTTPTNRNAILEEFTGSYCQYCPEGHKLAKELAATNPDKIFIVNLHSGGYATSNFITADADAIYSGFIVNSFPSGLVNRTTEKSLSRNEWGANLQQQLGQVAECNVAGQVTIDKQTRKATVTVEVYYTSNSASETNYLNVIMLQDNLDSYQAGADANPEQIVNGQYRHMHVFRDAITPSLGEAISPTTAGTLITKTYTYDVPQTIGFNVNLDNIEFLAFVTEKQQTSSTGGTATRPILNANRLHTLFVTNDDIHPSIVSMGVSANISCSNDKVIDVVVNNSGVKELTSLKFEVAVDKAEAMTRTWEGSIPKYETLNVELDVNIPTGMHDVNVKIVEANGVKFEVSKNLTVNNEGWGIAETTSDMAEITIELMQDKYGKQITWELLASDYSVIASGGPYENLSGSSATELHEIKVNVPAGECIKFIIRDSKKNGICCQYGEGYYRILDEKGNVALDGDGAFGEEASHIISIVKDGNGEGVEEISSSFCIYPNPVNDVLYINAETEIEEVSVYDVYGRQQSTVNGQQSTIDVSRLNTGIYFVRIKTNDEVVTRRFIKK